MACSSGKGTGFIGHNKYFPLLILILMTSCSRLGDYARDRADRAAYGIISEKQTEALDRKDEFTIDQEPNEATKQLLSEAPRIDFTRDHFTSPSYVISLGDSLAIAVSNSRDYQSQKENLYTQALSLTETRRDYGYLFTGSAGADVTRTETGNHGPDDHTVEWFGSRGFSAGVTKLLATGARISLDFSHGFLRFFTNDPRPGASNSLTFSIVQPLLRGAGKLVARESLLQAERNMIYNIRSFRRYQQQFIIERITSYYNLLSAGDRLENARDNYVKALENQRKLEKLADGGRASGMEVDQASQKVLEAEARLSRARTSYGQSLDLFKIELGIPVEVDVGPNPAELDRIAKRGLLMPDMNLEQALEIALSERLDLKNVVDYVEDSRRSVKIALRNFLPDLDFGYNYSTSTGDEKDRVRLDFEDNTNDFSLGLGIPFDWTPRRNQYRLALLGLDQAERSLGDFRDRLILEVRDAWRTLQETRTDYRIQRESVRLAERRVKNATMLLERGKATARDLLEAEDSLLESQNALTNALVSNTIQRLRFWNAIEKFEIDEKGLPSLE